MASQCIYCLIGVHSLCTQLGLGCRVLLKLLLWVWCQLMLPLYDTQNYLQNNLCWKHVFLFLFFKWQYGMPWMLNHNFICLFDWLLNRCVERWVTLLCWLLFSAWWCWISSLASPPPNFMCRMTLRWVETSLKTGFMLDLWEQGSVVRALDSWLKGHGFESGQEWWENFLLQGQPSVLTHFGIHSTPVLLQ